jgi:hypothetical protein
LLQPLPLLLEVLSNHPVNFRTQCIDDSYLGLECSLDNTHKLFQITHQNSDGTVSRDHSISCLASCHHKDIGGTDVVFGVRNMIVREEGDVF